MSRLVAYRTKAPALVAQRIDETLAATMYLVQTTGPTCYVVQEQNSDKKHKVMIGALQTCSCGDADVCVHVLFVLLKVLRVPATTPIVWQKSLIDSEVDTLLQGGYREQSRPEPKPFMKKRRETVARPETDTVDADVERHELVEGEVCAICQEDMDDTQPLTYCKKGCGNNFHIECMKVFGESRKQTKDNIICPLCRHDWGDSALTALKKEIDVANQAPNVHKNTTCKRCQTKPIRNERYRCVQCKNVDLCSRCFKANTHAKHPFIMKKNVTDPWIPGARDNQRQAISEDLISDLEGRELSTNDYELLLQLDQAEKYPLQDYLLSHLSGTQTSAEDAKSQSNTQSQCLLCSQTLRMLAALRTLPCGHTFHESCISRSILAQVYACPDPSCDFVLFPGLHSLTNKSGLKKLDDKAEQTLKTPSDQLLAVLGVHPTALPASAPQADRHRLKPITRTHTSMASRSESRSGPDHRHEETGLPDLLTFKHIGAVQPHTNRGEIAPLKSLARFGSTQNQQEHDTPSDRRKKPLMTSTNKLPPLYANVTVMGVGNTISLDDRLNHAEKARAELRKIDKDRLRKQREERELRSRRALDNNQLGTELSSVPSIGTIRDAACPPVAPKQRAAHPKARKREVKPTDRHQFTPQQCDLNELFIGHYH